MSFMNFRYVSGRMNSGSELGFVGIFRAADNVPMSVLIPKAGILPTALRLSAFCRLEPPGEADAALEVTIDADVQELKTWLKVRDHMAEETARDRTVGRYEIEMSLSRWDSADFRVEPVMLMVFWSSDDLRSRSPVMSEFRLLRQSGHRLLFDLMKAYFQSGGLKGAGPVSL
jgi:hypothetical protein